MGGNDRNQRLRVSSYLHLVLGRYFFFPVLLLLLRSSFCRWITKYLVGAPSQNTSPKGRFRTQNVSLFFCYPKFYILCLGCLFLFCVCERIPFGGVSSPLFVTTARAWSTMCGEGPSRERKRRTRETTRITIRIMR